MADLDIDSLLQDLDDAVETSPQHSKGKYQGVTQENLHPQNVLRNAFNDKVFLNKNDSDGGTVDDSTLDKLLSIMPIDVDDSKALAPHSPVCPLKRRPLKESKLHLTASNAAYSPPEDDTIDNILSSANDAINAGDSPTFRHTSPRPPPPRKRTGGTPQPTSLLGEGGGTSTTVVQLFDADIFKNGQQTTPPVSPTPIMKSSRPGTALEAGDAEEYQYPVGGRVSPVSGDVQLLARAVIDVSDFDEYDPLSPARLMTPATSRPSSAVSPASVASSALAAAVADGTIPDIDTEGLTHEIDSMLGHVSAPASASASAARLVSDGKGSFTALPQAANVPADQKKLRCIKCCVNGPGPTRGHKQSSFSRDVCCGNLRCIKCNFSVRTYPYAAWDSTVDYMFLRNAFPDDLKLSTKMVAGEGSAYCCQCSWIVASEEQDTKDLGLSWSCSGHAEAS